MGSYENPSIEVEDITSFTELKFEKKAKLIAIPTTSGTGSEASFGIALKDLKEKHKVILGSHYIIPYIVILDLFFPSKMPKKLTVATGFDALAHAVES